VTRGPNDPRAIRCRHGHFAPHHRPDRNFPDQLVIIGRWRSIEMNQLIYLVGLIVVILAILSFFGLR
jgi:hypothetical protein